MYTEIVRQLIDFITFPIRAITLIEADRFGLSSLQSERYFYVSKEVKGYCLDIGCGRKNRFIKQYLGGNGIGIDVYKYDGLAETDIILDPTKLPYENEQFDTISLIANINHIPRSIRSKEFEEIYRVNTKKGLLIVTMGNPLAELMIHTLLKFYDRYLHTNVDVDSERGMETDESYYLTDYEIKGILKTAGYKVERKKYFWTQWGLNHLFVASKQLVVSDKLNN